MTRQPSEIVEFSEPAIAIFEDWEAACESVAAWEERRDNLAGMIMEYMGDAKQGRIDGVPVVTHVRAGTYTKFNEARFHQDQPDLWGNYVEEKRRAGHLRRVHRKGK